MRDLAAVSTSSCRTLAARLPHDARGTIDARPRGGLDQWNELEPDAPAFGTIDARPLGGLDTAS